MLSSVSAIRVTFSATTSVFLRMSLNADGVMTLTLLDSRALVELMPGSRQMAVELFVASQPLLPLMFQDVNRLYRPS